LSQSSSPKEGSAAKDSEQLAVIFDVLGTPSKRDREALAGDDPKAQKHLDSTVSLLQ
jgi:hypothetical protein